MLLVCQVCQLGFTTLKLYQRHKKKYDHRENKPYKCELCECSYNFQINFKLHKATHQTTNFQCPQCEKSFKRFASLKSHLMVHAVEDSLNCSVCNEEFILQSELDYHNIIKHHFPLPYNISLCDHMVNNNHADINNNLNNMIDDHIINVIGNTRTSLNSQNQTHADNFLNILDENLINQQIAIIQSTSVSSATESFFNNLNTNQLFEADDIFDELRNDDAPSSNNYALPPSTFNNKYSPMVFTITTSQSTLNDKNQPHSSSPYAGRQVQDVTFSVPYDKQISKESHSSIIAAPIVSNINHPITPSFTYPCCPSISSNNSLNFIENNNYSNTNRITAILKDTYKNDNRINNHNNFNGSTSYNRINDNCRINKNSICRYLNNKYNSDYFEETDVPKIIAQLCSDMLDDIANANNEVNNDVNTGGNLKTALHHNTHWDHTVVCLNKKNITSNKSISVSDSLNNGTNNNFYHGGDFCSNKILPGAVNCSPGARALNKKTDLIRHLRKHSRKRLSIYKICRPATSFQSALVNNISQHIQKSSELNWSRNSDNNVNVSHNNCLGVNDMKFQTLRRNFNSDANLNVPSLLTQYPETNQATVDNLNNQKSMDNFKANSRQNQCMQCKKLYSTSASLNLHMRLHTGYKPFSCQICFAKFRTSGSKRSHMITSHPNLDLTCSLTSSHYKENINTFCVSNDTNANKAESDRNHDIKNNILIDINDNNNIIYNGDLNENNADNANNFNLGPINSIIGNDRIYQCDRCEKRYKKISHLKEHIRSHTGEKPYSCPICKKLFATNSILKQHTRTHLAPADQCNFLCHSCPIVFNTRGSLKRHCKVFHEANPNCCYQCTSCRRNFRNYQNYRKHMASFHNLIIPNLETVTVSTADKKNKNMNNKKNFNINNVDNTINKSNSNNNNNENVSSSETACLDQSIASHATTPNINQPTNSNNNNDFDIGLQNNYNSSINIADVNFPSDATQKTPYYLILQPTYLSLCNPSKESNDTKVSNASNNTININNNNNNNNNKPSYAINNSNIYNYNNDTLLLNPDQIAKLLAIVSEQNVIPDNDCKNDNCNINNYNSNNNFGEDVQCIIIDNNNSDNSNADLQNELNLLENSSFPNGNTVYDLSDNGFDNIDAIIHNVILSSYNDLSHIDSNLLNNDINTDNNSSLDKTDNKGRKNERNAVKSINNKAFIRNSKRNNETSTFNTCTYCGKMFKKPSDLIRHIRTHTGERPYECTLCEKRFTVKSALQVHLATHDGSKPHVCTLCQTSFTARGSLQVHMRLHTGLKPYKCLFCDATFRTIGHRKSHIHWRHPITCKAPQNL